jgi:hypothetical protein
MSDGPATIWRDKSIDLNGASQQVFPDVGYNGCQERFVANPSAANNIWVNPFGNAAVAGGKGSFLVAPGGYWSTQSTNAINVIGTNGQACTAGER